MGQMLVFANPFKWEMLFRDSTEGLEVLFKGVTSRNLTSGVRGKKGGRDSVCRAETCGTGCAITHPLHLYCSSD